VKWWSEVEAYLISVQLTPSSAETYNTLQFTSSPSRVFTTSYLLNKNRNFWNSENDSLHSVLHSDCHFDW